MKIYVSLSGAAAGFSQDIRELSLAFFAGAEFVLFGEDAAAGRRGAEGGGRKSGGASCGTESGTSSGISGGTEGDACECCEAGSWLHLSCGPEGADAGQDAAPGLRYAFSLFEGPQAPLEERFVLSGERREDKSVLKKALYLLLSRYTGKELPWGTLTGIRPVKIAETKLAEGLDRQQFRTYTKEKYLLSDEKTELIRDIAERERRVLSRVPYREGWSLYLGIPFCPTRCLYCSFTAYPIAAWESRVEEYLSALGEELRLLKRLQEEAPGANCIAGKPLQTVYVGGGTPTSLSAEQLARLLGMLSDTFGTAKRDAGGAFPGAAFEAALCPAVPEGITGIAELTVEAGRPDSITQEKLEALRDFGVTRISINPQSMNLKTLDAIGRRHTPEQTKEAFLLARELEFTNINMDLIMGLPGEDLDDVRRTLSKIRELSPDSLTVHALAVKRAARLTTEGLAFGGLPRADGEEAAAMMQLGAQAAREMGLFPYYLYRQKNMAGNGENTGYAREGAESLYNILMMEERHTVLGAGAGASSKVVTPGRYGTERFENMKNVAEYLPRIGELLEKKEAFLRGAGIAPAGE